jgi:hypothetical protein
LNFEDKNKLTEGAASFIHWDAANNRHTLKSLMNRRFGTVLQVQADRAWDRVFNERQEMPGHQSKYQHIVDRTMLRPRDMIKFCNECLAAFKDKPENIDQIENRHINEARARYSDYLLREIIDEIHKHVTIWPQCIEVLRELDAVTFDRAEISGISRDRVELLPDGVDINRVLSDLFEFSVIGYYAPGGKGYGGAQYTFKYKEPRAIFNPHALSYQVHLGLQEALNLKRYSRQSSAAGAVSS